MTSLDRRWIAFSLCLAATLSGCSSGVGERMSVRRQIKALTTSNAKTIDLSQVGSTSWSRLCILTPYSTNRVAEDALGFEWDAEKTNIELSEDVVLLVFASGDNVDTYVAYPREDGDFSPVGFESSCLSRNRTKFAREQDDDGWVTFVPAE